MDKLMDKLWIIHGNMDKLTLWIVVRHGGVLTMWARDTFCSKSTFWDAQKTLLTNLPTSWSPFLSLWFFHHVLKKIIWVSPGFKKITMFTPGLGKDNTRCSPSFHQVYFSPCFEKSSNTLAFGSPGVVRAETKRCLLRNHTKKNQTCVFTLPSKVQNTYCITSLATVGQNTCWAL